MSLLDNAIKLATFGHRNQTRKYTGDPYIMHCIEVAGLLTSVNMGQEIVAAGMMHDLIEDTPLTYEDIRAATSGLVADIVAEVTDVSKPKDGNRAIRKAKDRDHLAQASIFGKTVKLADMISNTRSIMEHDLGFAKIYIPEKRAVMEVIVEGHPGLYQMANQLITDAERRLEFS